MKARFGFVAVAVAATLAAGACTKEIKNEIARDKQIDRDLAAVTAGGVPGVALVIRDGGDKTRIAHGVGEVAGNVPMRIDDRVRIGSVAKTYVAVVVMQMVAENKLSLDDTVQTHLPGIVPNASAVTVRQLLNHSSGIANYEEHPEYMAPYMAGDFEYVSTPQRLIAMAVSMGARFAPGTVAEYSNTNYTLLGLMIEKISGQTLGQQFEARIFKPLGLKASSTPTQADIAGQHAHGYFVLGQPPVPATDVTHFSPSIGWSGGGIVSTVDDVTTFYRALFDGKLVRADLLDQMMTTVTDVDGKKRHGLGLVPRETPCGTVWGHSGNFPGYMMDSYVKPGGGLQVTIAYNLDPNSMTAPTQQAVEGLFNHAFCGAS